MNPVFEFFIVIVTLSFVYKLVLIWMRQRDRRQADDTNDVLLKRVAQLEERVEVLERIVTDERFDLKRQFKDLES